MDFKEKIHSMKNEYYDMMNRASNTIHFGTRLMAFEIPINQKTKIIININWDNGNVLPKNSTVSMWGKN